MNLLELIWGIIGTADAAHNMKSLKDEEKEFKFSRFMLLLLLLALPVLLLGLAYLWFYIHK